MDPVRKHHIWGKFIHPLPKDLSACFHKLDHFECLRPLADCITGMTSPAEANIWNPCSPMPFHIAMAEKAV
jgi:hypothetical protein